MKIVLIKPLITEKVTNLSTDLNKYGFVVDYNTNKFEIAKAVQKKYGVNVESVNTIRYKGKAKTMFRRSGRFTGKTPKFKKAIVTLKKGEKIEIFEQA
ncbi:MAG: 50S ribosomal protein L23 [Ignavibacteriaceae bacterium]|nr:50S ribosomal protein L23 [Ignavibacteriaceae bacterium]NUM69816.1 50S ribosomal protein L23 [Ignavibacteriaceae bacterium]